MSTKKRVCLICGGDGDSEFFLPVAEALQSMKLDIDWLGPPVEGEAGERDVPAGVKQAIDDSDAALFGYSLKYPGITTYLKWEKRTYAHIRPVTHIPGCKSPLRNPEHIDYVLVRENLEGLYPGTEGDLSLLRGLELSDHKTGRPFDANREGAFALRVATVENTKNIAEFACRVAEKRKEKGRPGRVTCATKSNMLHLADGLFRRVVEETVAAHPGLSYEHWFIDDMAGRLVDDPDGVDVLVTPNLYGDILGDVGAATVGGLQMAPRAAIGDGYAYFDTLLQTQKSLAGRNVMNPSALFLSAAMLFGYLGFPDAARAVERAVRSAFADGACLTRDQGGSAGTDAACREIARRL